MDKLDNDADLLEEVHSAFSNYVEEHLPWAEVDSEYGNGIGVVDHQETIHTFWRTATGFKFTVSFSATPDQEDMPT